MYFFYQLLVGGRDIWLGIVASCSLKHTHLNTVTLADFIVDYFMPIIHTHTHTCTHRSIGAVLQAQEVH